MADQSDDTRMGYQIKDPEKLAANMFGFLSEGARALTRYVGEKRADGPYAVANELTEASKILGAIAQRMDLAALPGFFRHIRGRVPRI